MPSDNPMEEWQRLTDVYREMGDVEIERIADQAYQLTDTAREVLRSEIRRRRLDVSLRLEPLGEESIELPESPYVGRENLDHELELRTLTTATSHEEAFRIEQALEYAGIAHFLGKENVDSAADVETSFEKGVPIKVRHLDIHRAALALRHLNESSDSTPAEEGEIDSLELFHCPKCGASDPTLEGVETSADNVPVDCWTCESCGHEWKDDGVVNQ